MLCCVEIYHLSNNTLLRLPCIVFLTINCFLHIVLCIFFPLQKRFEFRVKTSHEKRKIDAELNERRGLRHIVSRIFESLFIFYSYVSTSVSAIWYQAFKTLKPFQFWPISFKLGMMVVHFDGHLMTYLTVTLVLIIFVGRFFNPHLCYLLWYDR